MKALQVSEGSLSRAVSPVGRSGLYFAEIKGGFLRGGCHECES
jgi:hypothetical protein